MWIKSKERRVLVNTDRVQAIYVRTEEEQPSILADFGTDQYYIGTYQDEDAAYVDLALIHDALARNEQVFRLEN